MGVHYVWYKNLYCGDSVAEHMNKVIRRLEKGKLEPGIFLLTLPENRTCNLLDIYRSVELKQPYYRNRVKYVVGIAKGKEEAIDLVTKLVDGMHKAGNTFNIRNYLGFYEEDYYSSDMEVQHCLF